MKKIKYFIVFSMVMVMFTVGAMAAVGTFNLKTGAWGAWGSPSGGVLKQDSNNGYMLRNSQSAWSDVYGDAYYAGKRASNSYYNISTGKNVWFSYVGGQGAAFNGRYVQVRVASSNSDPNAGSVNITFAP